MDAADRARTEAALRALYEQGEEYVRQYRALSRRDFAAVYPLVFGYVRARFLLQADMCPSEALFDLADVSLRRILALRREGVQAGEIARSCAGASSVISKKILLFKAMGDSFGFSVSPEDFARITTVTELTRYILSAGSEPEAAESAHETSVGPFDPETVRADFPALVEKVHGQALVYLDNAATAQMPRPALDALVQAERLRGNVHRAVHTPGERSTALYESARRDCAAFLGAKPEQLVFTSGTTDGIGRVADALASLPGGVVTTAMEHHANFVPWQQTCRRLGRPFRVCPVDADGRLDMDALAALLTPDISVLAVTHASNVLGTVNDVRTTCALAHERGVRVLVDGAQSACHRPVDVEAIGCDWFVCSGHKLGGPFGIGLLYCREALPPVRFGGGMVDTVTEAESTFLPMPSGAEAGTPNVSGAAALAAALRYRMALPDGWRAHEAKLLAMTAALLAAIPHVRVLGRGEREGCLSFVVDGVSALDAALLLDGEAIALRSGNHCAQPLMAALGVDYTLRVSPAFYNTEAEIERFAAALRRVVTALRQSEG